MFQAYKLNKLMKKLLETNGIFLARRITVKGGMVVPVIAVRFDKNGKVIAFQDNGGDLTAVEFPFDQVAIEYR